METHARSLGTDQNIMDYNISDASPLETVGISKPKEVQSFMLSQYATEIDCGAFVPLSKICLPKYVRESGKSDIVKKDPVPQPKLCLSSIEEKKTVYTNTISISNVLRDLQPHQESIFDYNLFGLGPMDTVGIAEPGEVQSFAYSQYSNGEFNICDLLPLEYLKYSKSFKSKVFKKCNVRRSDGKYSDCFSGLRNIEKNGVEITQSGFPNYPNGKNAVTVMRFAYPKTGTWSAWFVVKDNERQYMPRI